jgi:hypothetical protein
MAAIMRDLCDRDPDWVFRRLLREVRVWLEEERARLSWLLMTPPPSSKVCTMCSWWSRHIPSSCRPWLPVDIIAGQSNWSTRAWRYVNCKRRPIYNIVYRAQANSTARAGSPHGSKGNVAVIAKFFGALLNTYTGMCIAVTQHKPLFQPLEKAFLSRYASHRAA